MNTDLFPPLKAGVHLEPGTYLAELSLSRPVSQDAFIRGLTRMGFSKIIVDQEANFITEAASAQTEIPLRQSVPFIAMLDKTITPRDAWCNECSKVHAKLSFAHLVSAPIYEDLTCQAHPYELLEGGIYEFRLLARRKSYKTKSDVERFLGLMGFHRLSPLILIKDSMYIPNKERTEFALYHAFARWDKVSSYTVTEDRFFFEDMITIYSPSHPEDDSSSSPQAEEPHPTTGSQSESV